jgi:ectoine hydroxylase-related dioxygenase (phytanoyl-CoA dioxygenase family)
MMIAENIAPEIAERGFAIVEGVLNQDAITKLLSELEQITDSTSMRRRGGIFAVRNLLDVAQEVRVLAESSELHALVDAVLGSESIPVRGILFDKIPDANWKVPWHQDVTIAVQEKIDAEGFGPWSIKADVLHVQPPAHVLENMISLRLHLDKCGEENGALRVLPGSHARGRIPEDQIAEIRDGAVEHIWEVDVGGVLLMRPLLLHASSPSRVPEHRRVIHINYTRVDLPLGMRWFSERD